MSVPAASEPRPELFVGLVAAVGTDHDQLSNLLEEGLRSFGYNVRMVRLTKILRGIPLFRNLKTSPVDEYIASHQKAGDDFRELIGNKDALAKLGIGDIRGFRVEHGGKDQVVTRTAYVIRSLKTPEEIELLRDVYGNAFFLIASSAPLNVRRRYLAAKIAESHHEFQHEPFFSKAEELIQIDQQEPDKEYGQNLKQAFHRADIFLDTLDANQLKGSLDRALELIFGNTFRTPSRDEYSMFQAWGASLRSSELGRQVGAVISNSDGDIIAVGTNEVPRSGGGLYWEGDIPDYREFVRGEDSSDTHKRNLIEDLLNRLRKEGWLHSDKANCKISELSKIALDPPEIAILQWGARDALDRVWTCRTR